jgi:hypothetical protein
VRPLSQLEDLPWGSLGANGDAAAVPSIVRMIAEGLAEERSEAWARFWDLLAHQGDCHEATVAVVPFLVGLLASGSQAPKHEILGALAELAEDPGDPPSIRVRLRAEIAEGLPIVLRSLQANDVRERRAAALVLREIRLELADLLSHAIPVERDDETRAILLDAYGRSSRIDRSFVRRELESATDLVVRGVAAAILLRANDGSVDESTPVAAVCDLLARRDLPVWLSTTDLEDALGGSPFAGDALQQVNSRRWGR